MQYTLGEIFIKPVSRRGFGYIPYLINYHFMDAYA